MAFPVLLVYSLITIFALSTADISNRQITKVLYPDCERYTSCQKLRDQNATAPNVSFPNVAYIKAAAGEDVLHFVLTTIGFPSVLVVHTEGDANAAVQFDWDSLLGAADNGSLVNNTDISGAITVNHTVNYSFAVVFSRLIEYYDAGDTSDLKAAENNKDTLWHFINFTEFQWMNVTFGQDGKSVVFNTSRPQPLPFENNTAGFITFEFEINGDGGRDTDLPRLIYNFNNTQLNFALDKYIPMFNKSRFALEMSVVANVSTSGMKVEQVKSIDDEYSPGVFKVMNWYTGTEDQSGYIQYKPVCYLDPHRERAVGIEVRSYDLQEPKMVPGLKKLMEKSIAKAFYGSSLNDTSLEQMASNVSFGLSGDGFYVKKNYTVWTVSIGYGKAPVETISTMVIIIIAAGLGIPVVIILFGGIYVCFRRRRGGYQRIDNDDVPNPHPAHPNVN